jgi:diphosphomevalonate decarboxylase
MQPEFTAIAHPNIAFIKYWGNRDDALRLPLNGSISMNLSGMESRTTVQFDQALEQDSFELNGEVQVGPGLQRVSHFLDHVRQLAGSNHYAKVFSSNNFPTGAGIASSASAFAALALAASKAAGLDLNQKDLSRLARLGSGSACRSIPDGFVEWLPGEDDASSYAFSIAPKDYWELVDAIAVISQEHKPVGSSTGHRLAHTSPLNAQRVLGAPERLENCREALLGRDFERFAEVVELDSHYMHAIMRTSTPPLVYWESATEVLLWQVWNWRKQGHAVCATVDAGPNVHVLALASELEWLRTALSELPGVKNVLVGEPADGARLAD